MDQLQNQVTMIKMFKLYDQEKHYVVVLELLAGGMVFDHIAAQVG